METLELKVEARQANGKIDARAVRREGRVPAIVYGPKMTPAPISFSERDFDQQIGDASSTRLLKLVAPGAEVDSKLIQIKDTQRHPVSHRLVHADFYEVDVNTKIRVEVPFSFVGTAAGIDAGGILQPIRREVEVECLPLSIPEHIEVDVSALNIGDAIHLGDINFGEGIEVDDDPEFTVVTVLAPVVEEVAASEEEEGEAAEGEAPAEGAAPGDEGAEKKEPAKD